ncbi:MAG: phosphoglycerate dehydrogenase [Lachnospiraceae bacterium]|nr:phosphoglycerate dehydrogenase [Lachnospiraceae bacterium]
MSTYKVIVTARSFGKTDSKAADLLKENGCDVIKLDAANGPLEEQLKKEIVDADAVIAGLEDYTPELIASGKKLKVISRYGVGYDKVDLASARENGVQVTITPGANGDSVADLAMALMLDLARNVTTMDNSIKAKAQKRPSGVEMWQKTLGIIGAGRIGQGVGRRCRGFDMKILCYDMYQNEEFKKECGAEYVDMDTLLRESDFITIHSPLTPETENMISTAQFQMMKKDAIIVNTARGGIVDEAALYEALKSGEIRGAGLDATAEEPPYDSPLLELDNCILTPHAGAATAEASSKMSYMAACNVLDVLTTGNCKFAVK